MKKCVRCGKLALFNQLNASGYCKLCEAWLLEQEAVKKKNAELRASLELERAAAKKRESDSRTRKKADKLAEISKIPIFEITLSEEPRKRQNSYEPVNFSNITPKGIYNEIVVFDTETTGLAPSRDRIVELAAVKYLNGKPVQTFQTYINPERPMPKEAQKVNGITDEMLKVAPVISQVLPAFEEFVGSSTMVAHNLNFDLRFLYYSGSEITASKRKYIDTLEQAQRLLKKPRDVDDHKLDTLCDYYHIYIAREHSALADAYAAGELFFSLVDEIQS